jgi:hypothetical protein
MGKVVVPALILSALFTAKNGAAQSLRLTVPAGAPVRVYLTNRTPKKIGQPVHARLLEPVYSFDREVIPAGTEATGVVTGFVPVPKMKRAAAILGGDFTPLHEANIKFTEISLPSGVHMPLSTVESIGLNSIYDPPKPKKAKKAGKEKTASAKPGPSGETKHDDGLAHQAKVAMKEQVNTQINARTKGIVDIVRSRNKKEKIEDYLWSRLPYHPQWVRRGTRFDAELDAPLDFGSMAWKPVNAAMLGAQPPADSVAHARLTTQLDSSTATIGDAVEAIVSAPLLGPGSKLILPSGTVLKGKVTSVHAARWFHRGGQLRFSFDSIVLPDEMREFVATQPAESKMLASLAGAEHGGAGAIEVDREGAVKVVEPKTRFIAPALALFAAARAMDNDAGHAGHAGSASGGVDQNVGGRALGGISGFGVFGSLIAQISPNVASALGMYGLAWSVYSTVISRGGEVVFQRNAAVDIRFGSRRPPSGPMATKLTAAAK